MGIRSHPIRFDMLFLKEGHDPTGAVFHPTTLDFKLAVLDRLLTSLPDLTHIEIFDDRKRHLDLFEREIKDLVAKRRLQTYAVHHIIQDPNLEKHMPEDLETELVKELVERTNAKIIAAREREEHEARMQAIHDDAEEEVVGKLGNMNASKSTSEKRPLPPPLSRIRRTSASLFRSVINLHQVIQYTAVFLDLSSRAALLSLVPVPEPSPNGVPWTIKADHMTVCLGPAPEDVVEGLGGIGAQIKLHVVALGLTPNRVLAVKVELDQPRNSSNDTIPPAPKLSLNETPHITIAVSHGCQAKESNDIQAWTALPAPHLILLGTLSHKIVTGIQRPPSALPQKPKEVSIGSLVLKHHPHLKGKEVGKAVGFVQKWMDKGFMDNAEANRARIEFFVSNLRTDEEGRAAWE
ncbi:hypothetical protein HDV05_008732 [Chytridiales sp. JEL 0842]|nr:hypothetical protein HDV05_008732 [Chytridiales sp. JEL 0842]